MFLRLAWGPLLGAAVASGWWAIGIWGFNPSGECTGLMAMVGFMAGIGSVVLTVILGIAMFVDLINTFPNVEEEEEE